MSPIEAYVQLFWYMSFILKEEKNHQFNLDRAQTVHSDSYSIGFSISGTWPRQGTNSLSRFLLRYTDLQALLVNDKLLKRLSWYCASIFMCLNQISIANLRQHTWRGRVMLNKGPDTCGHSYLAKLTNCDVKLRSPPCQFLHVGSFQILFHVTNYTHRQSRITNVQSEKRLVTLLCFWAVSDSWDSWESKRSRI